MPGSLHKLCEQRKALTEQLLIPTDINATLSSRLFEMYKNDLYSDMEALRAAVVSGRAEWDRIYAELRKHRAEHGC